MDQRERAIKEREFAAKFTVFTINMVEANEPWFNDNEHRFNTFMRVMDHSLTLGESDPAMACIFLDKLLCDAMNLQEPPFTEEERSDFTHLRDEFYAFVGK